MTFVVDTSVTMAWWFEDEITPATEAVLDRLATEDALVPALWALEVANVLLVAERRGRITEAQAARFVALLRELPLTLDLAPPDLDALLASGHRHRLSAYDAAYLALAEREGLPLATLDKALRNAALTAGISLLVT